MRSLRPHTRTERRAALLPKPRCASPLGAATLGVRAGGRQHAEETDGFLRWAPPVFEGQRHQVGTGSGIPSTLVRSRIGRSLAIVAGPGPKPTYIVRVRALAYL